MVSLFLGDGLKKSAADILSFSKVTVGDIKHTVSSTKATNVGDAFMDYGDDILNIPSHIEDSVDANCKYSLYLNRQENEIQRFKLEGGVIIPKDIQYTQAIFPALSNEELEKLQSFRPETLHHASQLEGMTSAGLVYLHHYIKRTCGTKCEESGVAREGRE